MEKLLEQDSIDAMFAAAEVEGREPAADSANGAAGEAERFNFSHAGQISNEQMRAISSVNDLFARNLMHTMGGWLRTQVEVVLTAGEQLPYGEFVGRLTRPIYVCSIRLDPFDALGLLELDLTLAWPMVDILLGGVGQIAAARELTDIEEAILGSVARKIVEELNIAWKLVGLQMQVERRETDDQVERMMKPMEKTLCMSFEMRVSKVQGMLNLCFPAAVLNVILRRMVADGGRPRRRPSEARTRLRELLGETTVGAVLQFPPMKLRARELAVLTPGTVLRLPLPRYADAEMRIGGLVWGHAQPVRTGEHRGAQIESLNNVRNRPAATEVRIN